MDKYFSRLTLPKTHAVVEMDFSEKLTLDEVKAIHKANLLRNEMEKNKKNKLRSIELWVEHEDGTQEKISIDTAH